MLYHGSKTSGIQTLIPSPHNIVDDEEVVFATNDIRFAFAMIYGTSKEIDVGYNINIKTGEEKMYMQELIPHAFNTLSKPGTIYTVDDSGFINDPRLSRNELISKKETKIIEEKNYENVLEELKKFDIDFIYKVIQ